MQTLVGTDPAAEERLPVKGRIYEAGARPELRPTWFTPDHVAASLTALVVLGATAFVIWQLHPMTLLFTNTMDAGGDNAGHIAAPYYLIHQLLTHGEVSGWDPNWFDGFPLYVFYFPLPALLIAIFNLVMPYAVAFKLITVSGSILMPGAAYLFGRLAGFRRPVPALMCVAILPFLWNTSYTIDGGNLASTMAGEFSFTLSMTFGLVFLGLVVNGLRTGRFRGLAALMFACTILCHVVPALFFAFAAVAFTAATLDWRRFLYLVPTGITGALLAGFWLVPFGVYLQYSSSMGYSRVANMLELFPGGYLWVLVLAGLGLFLAVFVLDTRAIALGAITGAAALAFWLLPSGQVYNERWLPFWFLGASLMAGYAFGEIVARISGLLEFKRWHETVGAVLGSIATFVVVGIPIGAYQFAGIGVPTKSFVPGWISWNYSGFQNKEGWNVFEGIVQMLGNQSKVHGCGRLEYEYTGSQLTDQFGSTMAFMSLPMWTNSCIDTTEGLYFESSTTTPYHFLDEAQISTTPSNPMVGIPYGGYDLSDGIKHLQQMGVRYLLAGSATTQSYAAKDPSLQYLASTPGVPTPGTAADGKAIEVDSTWKLYMVKSSQIVSPLKYEPVVENVTSSTNWLDEGIAWYQGEQYWPVPVVRGGLASWPHDPAGILVPPSKGVPIQPTTVSNIVTGDQSISFDVTQTGVPVLVKIPYFPNWQATGAEGPWEATPNLMVVVPTSHHVTLTYGTSKADWAGYGSSILGIGLLITFVVLPPVNYERWRRRLRRTSPDGAGDGPDPDGDHDPFALADLGLVDVASDHPWLAGDSVSAEPTGLVPVVALEGAEAGPLTEAVPAVDAPPAASDEAPSATEPALEAVVMPEQALEAAAMPEQALESATRPEDPREGVAMPEHRLESAAMPEQRLESHGAGGAASEPEPAPEETI